ncbi:MAG: hypothetical protein GWM98_27290 [Nitrospinaceae bacterium]|nr:hypothetical protein [Nitrospinaceae bacterium]NIT84816.1 hypothetical protein [Nitrospinaceae bacterium]NIW08552.1 hypothetical protein [Nitrospinaceae bacterium]NIX37140.1 hypothetical protein [Nitrospinaceae bacterium]NIY18298.1 hypothetical protein [Nitrospinaceae bacterium]
MKTNYSPQLMEEAVFRHLNHLERSGLRADYDEYHSLADPIYELPEDDREEAFAKVNELFFREKLGLDDHVLSALEACGLIPKRQKTPRQAIPAASENATGESVAVAEGDEESESSETASESDDPSEESELVETLEDTSAPVDENSGEILYEEEDRTFEEKIKEITIKRAINKVDEGSNVLNRVSGLPVIEMRVLASRFANPEEVEELGSFLIHEFMHARDMMDPEFDYEDAFIPGNPSMKNLITARFRLLWNIYVDSRLARKKIRSVMTKEARYREFDNYYRKIPEKQRRGIFEGLWNTEKQTHEELLSMATDLETLISTYIDYSEEFTEEDREYIHLQGSPCPLCKFPTYNWVDDPESVCDEMVIEAIQIDFPDWESKDGACDRCIEVYELRAGTS